MSAPVRIQRKRTKGWTMPENTVYVGRPTQWGNWYAVRQIKDLRPGYVEHVPDPAAFVVARLNKHGRWTGETFGGFNDRLEASAFAVELHRRSLLATRLDVDGLHHHEFYLRELRGKNLACWCPLVDARGRPVPCHADVLLELANGGESG